MLQHQIPVSPSMPRPRFPLRVFSSNQYAHWSPGQGTPISCSIEPVAACRTAPCSPDGFVPRIADGVQVGRGCCRAAEARSNDARVMPRKGRRYTTLWITGLGKLIEEAFFFSWGIVGVDRARSDGGLFAPNRRKGRQLFESVLRTPWSSLWVVLIDFIWLGSVFVLCPGLLRTLDRGL
jgi:hypothetical protein